MVPMHLEKFLKKSAAKQPARKNNLFLRMLPYAAAAILSSHAPHSFSQGMDTVLARGKEIRVVCEKDTTSLEMDLEMKARFGLDSIPEKHKTVGNTYSSGFREFYIMAKGARGVIVVFWSPESERYSAQVLGLGKDTSKVGCAIIPFGKGLVAVKERSILISNEQGLFAVDLDSAVQRYGEIGDIIMHLPKSGMLHLYPIDWLGRAWMIVDPANAEVRVKKMKVKAKTNGAPLIDI